MRAIALAFGVLCILGAGVAPCLAANCTGGSSGTVVASATSLLFGSYKASNTTTTVVPFSVTLACSGGDAASTLPPMSIALSSGAGSYTARQMSSGGTAITYQIYTSASLSVVWGDGTGATSTVSSDGGASSQVVAGYAVIGAGQWVQPGAYTDNVTVVVSY